MQVTVIGASRGIGLKTVELGLEKGWKIIAMSRNFNYPTNPPNLVKMRGSSTNLEDIKNAIAGSDAVIITIGTINSTKATTVFTETANALVKVFKEKNAKIPVIIITGFGAGDSKNYQSFIVKNLLKLFLSAVYKDKANMEEIIRASCINWEIVRPGRLTNGGLTGNYRVIDEYEEGMKVNKISRADVAHFLLSEAANPTKLHKFPALTY